MGDIQLRRDVDGIADGYSAVLCWRLLKLSGFCNMVCAIRFVSLKSGLRCHC